MSPAASSNSTVKYACMYLVHPMSVGMYGPYINVPFNDNLWDTQVTCLTVLCGIAIRIPKT